MSSPGTLYLLPNTLTENTVSSSLPPDNLPIVQRLQYFFVENRKTARRFLKDCGVPSPFDHIEFYLLDKNTKIEEDFEILMPLFNGNDMGLVSESGIPAIADPGAKLIQLAHQNGTKVKPLVGPSSIFLALMSSGLNGQEFTFHGYLPVNKSERKKRLKDLEKNALETGYTQIFMETPYRNDQVLTDITTVCKKDTLLCIACDITSDNEEILTVPVGEWKMMERSFHKRPAIFLLNGPGAY